MKRHFFVRVDLSLCFIAHTNQVEHAESDYCSLIPRLVLSVCELGTRRGKCGDKTENTASEHEQIMCRKCRQWSFGL